MGTPKDIRNAKQKSNKFFRSLEIQKENENYFVNWCQKVNFLISQNFHAALKTKITFAGKIAMNEIEVRYVTLANRNAITLRAINYSHTMLISDTSGLKKIKSLKFISKQKSEIHQASRVKISDIPQEARKSFFFVCLFANVLKKRWWETKTKNTKSWNTNRVIPKKRLRSPFFFYSSQYILLSAEEVYTRQQQHQNIIHTIDHSHVAMMMVNDFKSINVCARIGKKKNALSL